ncbi:hypothetical protein AG1IA_09791 [Rhizoctonia solani AG-1 IA]|uniref:Uncharacterized protein n=1 Tax=Thanatephorus cucumeris (strain AG1-IA) TaxID=983506 RepID=L8WIK3_THACA|nr:hypothetical protein AG1IA_09791 [Rhizoctonia solani AG-1 IA]
MSAGSSTVAICERHVFMSTINNCLKLCFGEHTTNHTSTHRKDSRSCMNVCRAGSLDRSWEDINATVP